PTRNGHGVRGCSVQQRGRAAVDPTCFVHLWYRTMRGRSGLSSVADAPRGSRSAIYYARLLVCPSTNVLCITGRCYRIERTICFSSGNTSSPNHSFFLCQILFRGEGCG